MRKILLLVIPALFIFSNCAKELSPTGGPKDIYPPVAKSYTPNNKTTNFNEELVTIQFNEYVKLSNLSKELIVSPPLDPKPTISTSGKKVLMDFSNCTLQDNTTYTINFGNSLMDNNEGNILSNFRYVFSTGESIDSLTVTGSITNAVSGKPIPLASVHLYSDLSDTAFFKGVPNYKIKTDSNGSYQFENIAPAKYQLYFIEDENNNHFPDNEENIGSYSQSFELIDHVIIPNIALYEYLKPEDPIQIIDTLVHNHYFSKFLLSKESIEHNIIIKSTPETTYLYHYFNNDTLNIFYNHEYLKYLTIEHKDSIHLSNLPSTAISDKISKNLSLSTIKNTFHLEDTIWVTSPYPFTSYNQDSISLEFDGKVEKIQILPSENSEKIGIYAPLVEGRVYNLIVKPNFYNFHVFSNRNTDTIDIAVAGNHRYGSIICKFIIDSIHYAKRPIIQLLKNNKVLVSKALNTNTIGFRYLKEGEYALRIVFDENLDGRWTKGLIDKRTPAEEIIHFSRKINVKSNWDLEINFHFSH
jgi:uncharacterized protein (DUF2141 family)